MPTKKSLTYRFYQTGDETRILTLFREAFNREMSPDFWHWRYVDNPYGRGIIRVALDGDKMVGHFAVIPMRVQFQGTVYPAIFPMTAMTHPEYGGQGLYTKLISEVYEYARTQGYALAYGFPNKNSYYPSLKFGYHDIITIRPLERKLPSGTPGRDGNITAIDKFDSRFDRLWENVRGNYKIIICRTSEYLNWRFLRNPDAKYTIFAYTDEAGDILGYEALKIYREGNIIRGHIVDILTVPDDNIARALVRSAFDYFAEERVQDVSLWMSEDRFYSRILEEEGFIRHPGTTHFAVMALDKNDKSLLPVENPVNWHLTMGDSDVF